ncbi:MAG: GDP-mannose 4,6-dehydratase [Clostridia bacterium]|nr:GDP-mannose 4,6-dehydratase [Clostridia bacterium]
MKALITGSLGFVGSYLRAELEQHGYEVVGLDIRPGDRTLQVDLMDADQICKIVAAERPDAIFHLAAQADVGRSWKAPQLTMQLNVVASINLLEAVRAVDAKDIRVVIVGSSDQYGNLGAAGADVVEDMDLKPQTPYAISKRAQEEMAKLYARSYGMNICMTRSFNHGGAGQRTGFMIPDFASGIVKVERGRAEALSVGNLTSRRDFSHVRDVVRAYRLIAEKGRSGEVYNVGSGRTYSAREVLDALCSMAKCDIPVRQDAARMRPSDTPVICCNHGKLTRDTGWEPEIGMEQILKDTLEYYRSIDG